MPLTEDAPPSARDRADALEEELRDRICLLDYPPGMRLAETELAEEFGISRTPLRRVLARLEAAGLLVSVHGVGTFVTDLRDEELDQIYRLRLELAQLAATLDPVPPDAALLARFRDIGARAGALTPDPACQRAFARLIMDFVLAQKALSANVPLMDFATHLYFQTARIWLHSLQASALDLTEEMTLFAREVAQVTAALEAGDLQAAALLHRAHVSLSWTRIRQRRLTDPQS
ncbi:GntR family transcriptional regulator [Pseudooceanicola sp. CBS1P-1]|uniref:GntR family transcriptional regulator n=1 Tax=Pseudooceanicola albus TaxID=2692189 RepID=A0A6L7G2J2_9RHOB|nr:MULTISPECIES: GntR family transcriptional regulator [Pseudooceanicola]MBT9383776.1 GntR family transcriptional regulator [Pseudooceanicola endophyticus]MXN17630.1 GntR family transcriptional regulator [Pseudooceanicola albus]